MKNIITYLYHENQTMIAMKKFISFLLISLFVACNANPTPDALKAKLKSTMNSFLNKSVNSSQVKFQVQDVVYYDDKQRNTYDCQFKVLMSRPGLKDTVGSMFAYISKDFQD